MRQSNFNNAAKTYQNNADIQPIVAQFVASQAQQHIPPNALALDIGCGTGQLQQLLPNHQIIGVDAAENMCATAKLTKIICANALHLPFAIATIDAAISSLCLQWLPLPQAASELHRVLKPSATAIIATLSHGTMRELGSIYTQANIAPRMLSYLTSAEIASIFKQCGFEITSHHQQQTTINHSSAWHFFKQLKAIGANQASDLAPLTRAQIKTIMQQYDQQFMQKNAIAVTYHWDCLTMQKA